MAPTGREATIKHAIESLIPPLERAGFSWREKSFDIGSVPPYIINLERTRLGENDYVLIIFDKNHKARFQILFGTKVSSLPHQWVKSGALVRRQSELIKYKWWGSSWWSLNAEKALREAVDRVTTFVPQVVSYIEGKGTGPNIWDSLATEQPGHVHIRTPTDQ